MADMAQQATGQPQERDNQQRNENKTKAPKTSFEKHVVLVKFSSFVRSAIDRGVACVVPLYKILFFSVLLICPSLVLAWQ